MVQQDTFSYTMSLIVIIFVQRSRKHNFWLESSETYQAEALLIGSEGLREAEGTSLAVHIICQPGHADRRLIADIAGGLHVGVIVQYHKLGLGIGQTPSSRKGIHH